jgi:hypothetical protein
MGILQHQLTVSNGQFTLASSDISISALIDRLESGEPPSALLRDTKLEPAALIAAIAASALGDDASPGPALEQARPSRPKLQPALSETAWVRVFPSARAELRLCLAAALLQIHDFWDPSHDAAQRADDLGERHVSAYWHGIAHRREPDPGNAAYGFRRVGRHPIFTPLASAAKPILADHGDAALTARLIPPSGWNSSAMIDFCTDAARRPGAPRELLARRLQRAEMWLLLEATVAPLLSPK